MAELTITLTVTTQDEPLTGDYEGQVVDEQFIRDYITGAYTEGGAELVPGTIVTQVVVDEGPVYAV